MYESTTQTSYTYDFDFGEHMYEIHQRFASNLNWNPPSDGTFYRAYRPFWIRASIIAHDGNARSSASGLHESSKYFVIYGKASPDEVSRIPMSP